MRRQEQRAADADREAVAERLREAVTEGRLDLDEFDERLVQTYRAKTYGELDPLVVDLPRVPAASRPDVPAVAHPVREWLGDLWRPWATAVSVCVAIWLFATLVSVGVIYFWPAWVAVPWGIVLVCRTIYGLASGEPHHWAANRARSAGPPRSAC
jgi:hypothetical protein